MNDAIAEEHNQPAGLINVTTHFRGTVSNQPIQSNFRKTAVTNIIASNLANASWEQLDAQLDLIQSELNETRAALKERNLNEMRDGVADMLVTVYGMGHRADFPVDEDYHLVDQANRAKFDTTLEDAVKTQQKYADLGVTTKIHEGQNLETGATHYVVKVEGNQGEKYPHGKYLKSYKWAEPVFLALADDHHLVRALHDSSAVFHHPV